MSIERVREYFRKLGIEDRVMEIDESSATVALAAKALGCEEGRIAKTISFSSSSRCAAKMRASSRFKALPDALQMADFPHAST